MKIFKLPAYTILALLIALILYTSIAFGLSAWTSHFSKRDNNKKENTIYILYDPMHSDIVINLEHSTIPWKKYLPTLLKSKTKGFISFGWGDKETYLNTPTWDDLKVSTALKALFINTPSLMHVTYIKDIHRFRHKRAIHITKEQHKRLEENIVKSFGKEIKFYQKGYRNNDNFYDSDSRQYNIINTCNTWTGERLYDANITMSPWTPFAYNVIYSLP
ncbi:MAG: hypothetical protein DSZ11_00620 [Sulfurovum sp.]|nr:MAG: hypothetical protein DSZ11_00620 [Sulfurovum sp.]